MWWRNGGKGVSRVRGRSKGRFSLPSSVAPGYGMSVNNRWHSHSFTHPCSDVDGLLIFLCLSPRKTISLAFACLSQTDDARGEKWWGSVGLRNVSEKQIFLSFHREINCYGNCYRRTQQHINNFECLNTSRYTWFVLCSVLYCGYLILIFKM